MAVQTDDSPVVFRVHDVEARREAWRTVPLHVNVREVLGGPIESCSDYHTAVCSQMDYQPLLAAVYQAYSSHYPLVLSPDVVWLTIAQGVAHHMAIHGEQLRNRFVGHQGKLELTFECDGWVVGTPENPWAEAFESWSSQIRDHVGSELHEALVCDFTTTTAVERAASHVVMMDIFEKYFRYTLMAVCGIPEITLRGATKDWERLADKVDALARFDMPWWLEHLRPIINQFVRASKGDVDLDHWRNICKLQEEYGGHIINGWVAKLFPYLRVCYSGPCSRRNPVFDTREGFMTFAAPSGLSQVPFVWRDPKNGTERMMEAIAGLVGVVQDQDSLALEPIAGWAVRQASEMDASIDRVKREHIVSIPAATEVEVGSKRRSEPHDSIPPDMVRFYYEFEQARLFDGGKDCLVHINPREEIESIDWGEEMGTLACRGPDGRTWYRFAALRGDEFLAINLDLNVIMLADDDRYRELRYSEEFHPICVVSEKTRNVSGQNPVVALTFTEFLRRLLNESTASLPYWRTEGFVPYADADQFTRRELLSFIDPPGLLRWTDGT